MVKKRGYTPENFRDASRLTKKEFVEKYRNVKGWSHLKKSSIERRYYYLRSLLGVSKRRKVKVKRVERVERIERVERVEKPKSYKYEAKIRCVYPSKKKSKRRLGGIHIELISPTVLTNSELKSIAIKEVYERYPNAWINYVPFTSRIVYVHEEAHAKQVEEIEVEDVEFEDLRGW